MRLLVCHVEHEKKSLRSNCGMTIPGSMEKGGSATSKAKSGWLLHGGHGRSRGKGGTVNGIRTKQSRAVQSKAKENKSVSTFPRRESNPDPKEFLEN